MKVLELLDLIEFHCKKFIRFTSTNEHKTLPHQQTNHMSHLILDLFEPPVDGELIEAARGLALTISASVCDT